MGIFSGGGGSGGSQPFLTAEVALTDAQIKALPTTPVQVVAAPGSGKMLAFAFGLITVDPTAGAYTNINASAYLAFTYGAGVADASVPLTDTDGLTAMLGGDAEEAALPLLPIHTYYDRSQVHNAALNVYIFNAAAGNLTGGNAANTGRSKVWYSLEDI